MNFYAISALVNFVTSVALGFFVLYKRRDAKGVSFFLFCFFVAFWSLSYFFWQIAQSGRSAQFWVYMLMAGAIYIPAAYLHFVYALLGLLKKRRNFLIFTYALFSVFLAASFSSSFISHLEPQLGFTFWPIAGWLFGVFLAVWFVYVIYTMFLLVKYHALSSGPFSLQLKYILMGTAIGFTGGSTNYFLFYRIPIPPIGNILVTVYVAAITYAIVRHRLMDIKVVLTQLFVLALWAVLLARTLISPLGGEEQVFNGALLLLTVVVGVFLVRSVMKEIGQREHIEKLYKKLQEANRHLKELMKIKAEFLQIASHQLRTPLTSLRGLLEMQAKGNFVKLEGKARQEMQAGMLGSANQLNNIVNDLLDAMELEGGNLNFEFAEIDVIKLIQEAIDVLKPSFDKKGLTISFQKPEDIPMVEADESYLRQVFLNTINNAEKYTEKGGLAIEVIAKEGRVMVLFTDTGIGIDFRELPKLFGKFVRGKRSALVHTDGSGLGLYIIKKIVDEHHGHVTLESKGIGQGTIVRVELPIKQLN